MSELSITSLKRKPKLHETLFSGGDGSLYVNEDCYVLSPSRYSNVSLKHVDNNYNLIGIYALVVGKNYTVCNIPAMQSMSPYTVTKVTISGIDYDQLFFKKDSVFLSDTKLVRKDTVVKDIFDEFFIKANIPWFMDYEDISKVFNLSKKYCDSNVGNNAAVFQLLTSVLARDPKDRKKYYRTSIKEDGKRTKPSFVGLENIFYSYSNTTNKIVGSYMSKGIIASLVNPSEDVENIERILRT